MMSLRRWTGVFALACIVFWLSQFPLYALKDVPSVYDGPAYARHLRDHSRIAFARILLDLGVYVTLMLFAAGLRGLIVTRKPGLEWLATLSFVAAAVWLMVTLVADGLAGGATLEAIGPNPDGSSVKALIQGTLLIYNGATAFAITGFYLATAGYAAATSGVLPRWTAWIAYGGTALCVLCIPAIYGGPVDYDGLYNTGSWLPALAANFPPAAWFLTAGMLLCLRSETGQPPLESMRGL